MSGIRWQLFLKVKSREKADRVLAQFAKAVGLEITVLEAEPYWKNPDLFRASVTARIAAESLAAAVVETLRIGSAVAGHWIVSAPQAYEGGGWEFSGSALQSSIQLAGVTDVFFEVSDQPPTEPPALTHKSQPEPAAKAYGG